MSTRATAELTVFIDARPVRVPAGCSAAAALAVAAQPGNTRLSVTGQRRAPVCGMGICHECRTTINGRLRLACQTPCHDGMRIDTGLSGGQP
jgi:predicted molibdopterin-dependent oxidoreductase YjgC